MKSLTCFFVLVVMHILPLQLFAQIMITADDMPNVDDTIRQSVTINTSGIDPEVTGADFVWDFSFLDLQFQQVDTFVSIQSTDPLFQLVFLYPIFSTIASPRGEFDFIPGFELTDSYLFYKETNDFFGQAGFAAYIADIPFPIRYNNPDVWYNFPVNYLDEDSSYAEFEFAFPDLGYYFTSRTRHNYADGWGTLITPYGSFETLRVKSEVEQYDSIFIDTLGFGFPVSRSYTEYKWLGKDMGIPLLQMNVEGAISTIQYIDSIRIITAVEDYYNSTDLTVYPNPVRANGTLYINLEDAQPNKISVLDLRGAGYVELKALTNNYENGLLELSLAHYNLDPGFYLLVISFDETTLVKKITLY